MSTLFKAAINQKCPNCQKGKIFSGLLTIANKCNTCGLDLGKSDTADGPSFVVMSLWGTIFVLAMLFIELRLEPPLWLYPFVWLPFGIITSLYFLRVVKSAMVAHQYILGNLSKDKEK